MKPLIVLIISFIITDLFFWIRNREFQHALAARIAMMLMLCFTAMGHFMFIDGMAAMLPDFVPMKMEVIIVTGVLEILLGLGLLIRSIYRKVGWGLILFLIAILPANIYAAFHEVNYQTGELDGPGVEYLWIRIPMQVLFITWVYYSAVKRSK